MARKIPTILRYNDATIRPRRGGWQADIMRGGHRFRRQFPGGKEGLAEARRYIDAIHMEFLTADRTLTLIEIEQARKAVQLLPEGTSLIDAAECWLDRHKRVIENPLIALAAERYVDEKQRLGLRDATINGARYQTRRLASAWPATAVADLPRADIAAWIERQNFKTPITRNNCIRDLRAFFSWCINQGYCTENPLDQIPLSAIEDDLPAVYEPAAVQAFLNHVAQHDPTWIPFHALGFFAGVRTAELQRITREHIVDGVLQVTPKASKTRSWRYIEMEPNLQAWLDAYPPIGPIQPASRTSLDRVRRQAGFLPWVHNAMRHSFATYHLAKYRDAARTAHDLGHPNANLVYKTYRSLAQVAQGDTYFGIRPT